LISAHLFYFTTLIQSIHTFLSLSLSSLCVGYECESSEPMILGTVMGSGKAYKNRIQSVTFVLKGKK